MKVLIVEDDPMVMEINKKYLQKIESITQIDQATSIAEAFQAVAAAEFDLILLDVHLKDGDGVSFLKQIRGEGNLTDVIMLTASNDAVTVKTTMQYGVLDFIVKPFNLDRLKKSFALLEEKRRTLTLDLDQGKIDQLFFNQGSSEPEEIEKGLTKDSLDLLLQLIKKIDGEFTINDLVSQSALSNVTIRKYVHYLEEQGILTSKLIYRKVGRPYRVFLKNE